MKISLNNISNICHYKYIEYKQYFVNNTVLSNKKNLKKLNDEIKTF